MVKRKNLRLRGKIKLSEYFQTFKKDEPVAVKREISVASYFPKRLQGRTGNVIGKRGGSYLIKMKDQNMEKEFLIEPVHLKKIKNIVSK
ncbi:MAG: 50S ribosomal protein L21e [Nanoarchaeota archaeon]|nr:50S ribosomal protein L21e [Nanoarchaeota archaeon]